MTAESIPIIQRVLWLANILYHQIIAVLICYILTTIFESFNADDLQIWHMVLTPFGFLVLMTESLIIYSKHNVYTLHLPRNKKKYIHGLLQCLGAILITVGISFKISKQPPPHFNSTHSILGLVAWILVWCSVFFGIAVNQAQHLKNIISPVWIKFCHILLGVSAFSMGLLSLGYAFKGPIFDFLGVEKTTTVAVIALAIVYLWSLIDVPITVYNLVKTIAGK